MSGIRPPKSMGRGTNTMGLAEKSPLQRDTVNNRMAVRRSRSESRPDRPHLHQSKSEPMDREQQEYAKNVMKSSIDVMLLQYKYTSGTVFGLYTPSSKSTSVSAGSSGDSSTTSDEGIHDVDDRNLSEENMSLPDVICPTNTPRQSRRIDHLTNVRAAQSAKEIHRDMLDGAYVKHASQQSSVRNGLARTLPPHPPRLERSRSMHRDVRSTRTNDTDEPPKGRSKSLNRYLANLNPETSKPVKKPLPLTNGITKSLSDRIASLQKDSTNTFKTIPKRTLSMNERAPPAPSTGARKINNRFHTQNTSSSLYSHKALPPPPGLERASSYLTKQNTQRTPAINGDSHGLVTIRMKPDAQGRFGFNVKGGADQAMPIIVSRVAPSTPADLCIPRLNEGDQVLFINGRDVSQHTHEQVVMFIRASRETHSGELELVVRPNVYIGEEMSEEPDFQYIPDTHQYASNLPQGHSPLDGSLLLLNESLQSGAALAQFEQLYRKKPGMTMNAAKLGDNIPKNRYRDISPYDQTRVCVDGQNGDYINANFVNMEIQGSGIVNRYIAAQGPLPNSCADFWQMVWEQQSRLVVMLTTKVERGRVKCHQYWPELYETLEYNTLHITSMKEELTDSFAFREFTLINTEHKDEQRHIQQMQYIAWPDHGVPDDSTDFLDFVMRVRQNRAGMVEPTVVHCSAGIGRTGVLITMETAMCLIEANQPVYPLDIVRQMRDQRAMLIQTASQYKFVCEAIVRVYEEKLVKPLEDYQR